MCSPIPPLLSSQLCGLMTVAWCRVITGREEGLSRLRRTTIPLVGHHRLQTRVARAAPKEAQCRTPCGEAAECLVMFFECLASHLFS